LNLNRKKLCKQETHHYKAYSSSFLEVRKKQAKSQRTFIKLEIPQSGLFLIMNYEFEL
jgi:hypothetical protein